MSPSSSPGTSFLVSATNWADRGRNITVWKILNRESAFATHRPTSEPEICKIKDSNCRIPKASRTPIITMPSTLNSTWIRAARFASFFPFRLARTAGVQEPMLQPKTT